MSEFNRYARKVDEIAKAAFEDYRKAERTLEAAEAKARQYPQRFDPVDAEYVVKSARARADVLEAREAMNAAKRTLDSRKEEFAELRKELLADVEAAYSADPSKLDGNTIELLKSGILTASEYAKFMREAQAAGNPTMVRMIGKYAEEAAAARAEQHGQGDEAVRTLRAVGNESRHSTGSEYLEAFDYMADVYNRAAQNPHMIDHWDELTAETVNNF